MLAGNFILLYYMLIILRWYTSMSKITQTDSCVCIGSESERGQRRGRPIYGICLCAALCSIRIEFMPHASDKRGGGLWCCVHACKPRCCVCGGSFRNAVRNLRAYTKESRGANDMDVEKNGGCVLYDLYIRYISRCALLNWNNARVCKKMMNLIILKRILVATFL